MLSTVNPDMEQLPVPNDPTLTYKIVISMFGIGLMISTLEYLAILQEFRAGGIYSWEIIRGAVSKRTRGRFIRRVLDMIYNEKGVAVLLVIRLVSAILVMFVPLLSLAFSLVAAVLLGSHLVFSA